MNPGENIVTRMVRPGISEEPDVPSEDNRTFEDGRLFPAGVSSQVRHYEPITTTIPGQTFQSGINVQRPMYETPLGATPIREAETVYVQPSTSSGLIQQQGIPASGLGHSLSHVDPITRKDADAIIENLPRGGIQEHGIPPQTMQSSIPGQQILTSTVVPQSQMYQQGSPIQGQPIQGMTPTAPVTYKDEEAIVKNLPAAGTIPQQTLLQQGAIPQQTLIGSTIPQQTVMHSTIPQQNLVQGTTSTIVHPPQENIPRTEVVREEVITTTTTTTTNAQPGLLAGGIATNRIENLNDINQVESQFMRDSGTFRGTQSPSYQSRYEAQQFELSTMRHESHQAFENWEANRNRFVNDRLNIMTDLLAGLERTIDWLDVGVAKVILFFKERESQELEYSKRVKHGLTQVGDHFQNAEHPEVLGNFSRGLKENDAFHAKEKQNSEIMGMFIKKDILDWILTPCEKNYKEQAHSLRIPLHTYKKKLDHLSSRRNKAYNKYFKTYDHIQKTGKPPKNEDSIFKRQLKYSLAAREELRMLRLYNEQGLNVINEFARLESARLQEVQRSYTMYLQKYRELYQNTATAPEPILSLIETSHGPESVPNLFTVQNLLQPHNYEFVRKTLGMPLNVSYEALDPFLVNFPDSIDPTRTSFVLKEWEAVKQGNIIKRPKRCSVIATTNNNLLIIERKNEEQELGKVREPMQLRFTKVEDVTATEDGTVLKVVERAPGTIFQHTTRTKLKFETPDEAQQFMQFVNTQTSGDV